MPDELKKAPPTEAELPFEEALKKLESIVEMMESGDLPLEGLLQRFEDGRRLLSLCQSRLDQAEVKIQKLEKNASGQATVKPLDKSSALVNE